MDFTSPTFLFFFYPVVTVAYYVARHIGVRNAILLAASIFFYSWGEPAYWWLIVVSIIFNYLVALGIDKKYEKKSRTGILVAGIFVNLLGLVAFKYSSFIVDNWNGLFASVQLPVPNVHLPLGVSFFTFHSISYLVDVYRGTTKAQKDFTKMALYISLFPQLLAGPIIRYHEIHHQLDARNYSSDRFAQGIVRFIVGLSKKLLIANTLAPVVDAIFAVPPGQMYCALAWLGTIAFTLQIYFDFSGYSDMAIGLALMFGFKFPENFDYPYAASSVREFWQKWHMSLSRFFRDYLYIPLGGNRHGKLIEFRNLVLVFFLCGLWHGANWKFVVWGLIHGLFLGLERTAMGDILKRMWRPLQHAYTLSVVMSGWVFFRAADLNYGWRMLKTLVGFDRHADPSLHPLLRYLTHDVVFIIVVGAFLSLQYRPIVMRLRHLFSGRIGHLRFARLACLASLLIMCLMEFAAGSYSPFIYFRF